MNVLINLEMARESDFGKLLARLPGMDDESLLVVWTMVERQEPEAQQRSFWVALPEQLETGGRASENRKVTSACL